jgi:hypothetical protein
MAQIVFQSVFFADKSFAQSLNCKQSIYENFQKEMFCLGSDLGQIFRYFGFERFELK